MGHRGLMLDGIPASASVATPLRFGRWQSALADVECDAVITDCPYSARTHEAINDIAGASTMPDSANRLDVSYASWTGDDVHSFVSSWAPRCRGWFACMTDDELLMHYKEAYRAAGLYAFAPLPIIQKRPRLLGDGPPSWTVYLMVARPRTIEFTREHKKRDGAYISKTDRTGIVAGAKPMQLMQAVVRDYSKLGDLVCDPCAGGATTLIAAMSIGRRAIGAECDSVTFGKAQKRIERGYTPDLFSGAAEHDM